MERQEAMGEEAATGREVAKEEVDMVMGKVAEDGAVSSKWEVEDGAHHNRWVTMDKVDSEVDRVATAVEDVVATKEVDMEVVMAVPRMVVIMVVAAKVVDMAVVSMDKVDTVVVDREAMEEVVMEEVTVEVEVVTSMGVEVEAAVTMDHREATIMRHQALGRIEETSVVVLEACPHMVDMEEIWVAVDTGVVEEAVKTCTGVVDPCPATISAWETTHSSILIDDKRTLK